MRYVFVILFLIAVQSNAQHEIRRIEGEDTNYSKTSIKWISQQEIIAQNAKDAEAEMWSEIDKKENNEYATLCVGGEIVLYVKRSTIESADLQWFTVIIKKEDSEIQRTPLKQKIASVPGSDDLWSNIKVISIKKKVTPPFDVFVIEAGGTPPKYHFQVIN